VPDEDLLKVGSLAYRSAGMLAILWRILAGTMRAVIPTAMTAYFLSSRPGRTGRLLLAD